MGKRLIIVTSRLPLIIRNDERVEISADPVSKAILRFINKSKQEYNEILWAGQCGCDRPTWAFASRNIKTEFNCIPVFVSGNSKSADVEITPGTISEPTQMDRLIPFFEEAISINLRPSDTVWIHGHELAALPSVLRRQFQELSIGLFIHLPFPSYESFRLLPRNWQEELLKGFLCADLVGFHKQDYVTNFLQCLLMIHGLDNENHLVHFEDRIVLADAFSEDEDPNSIQWVFDFLPSLQLIKQKQSNYKVKFLDEYTRRHLNDAYRLSKKRLILLDYDGTLVSFSSKPEMAVPGNELRQLIQRLSSSSSNDVFLVSGRNSAFLEQHFGDLPVNLIAEHGASYKWKNSEWIKEVDTNNEWKKEASVIMETYVKKCERSFVEEKEFSIAWHYRSADHEDGKLKAFQLASELKVFVENKPLQVMMGKKIVELRQSGINKGSFVRKVIKNNNYDYIFAAGDDRTDEDMFRALINKANVYTIKVGPEASYAEYNLHTPQMVLSLLEGFDHLTSPSLV